MPCYGRYITGIYAPGIIERMGNILFNARVRYLNWRLREQKCLAGCGSRACISKYEYRTTTPTFCSAECRDEWHTTMAEV